MGRYWVIGGIFLLIAIALAVSILQLISGESGNKWRQIGQGFHRPSTIELPPIRGSIYAADDRPLAISAPSYQLYLDFQALPIALLYNDSLQTPADSIKIRQRKALRDSLGRELDKLADVLEQIFAEQGAPFDKRRSREAWRRGFIQRSNSVLISRNELSYLQYQQLQEIDPLGPQPNRRGERVHKSLLNKIIVKKERSRRVNPFGSLALRTIGSLYAEQNGGLSRARQGIELYCDSLLRGEKGTAIRQYAAGQYNRKVVKPAVDGASVYTTLDMNKQNELERIMRKQLAQFSARSGSAVLMEVTTGKILAMTNLERSANGDDYLETKNFAVSDMSEPGSTFKVASMLVALDLGLVSPTDTIDVGNGVWTVAGRNLRDHNADRGGYGRISVSQVIERSSNVGTAKIIHKHFAHRPDEFVNRVRALGFGMDLGIEIPGAARAVIRRQSDNPNRWYGTTLPWMSFGYETQIPPIYTLSLFNAIANGGRYMRPHLIREIRTAEGEPILRREPEVLIEQIARPEAIAMMQDMLRKVVTEGTGKSLRSDVVSISGKSGTAQIARGGSYNGPDGKSHEVSFCGYFPSESPRYTLMVVLREPSKAFSAGGGSMAGPVVKELAETIVSMEQPLHLDSIKESRSVTARPRIASGRRGAIEPLLRTLGITYAPGKSGSLEHFIRIDPAGQEHVLAPYAASVVPAVVGMSASDAYFLLLDHGYLVKLEGRGQVIGQSLPAGTRAASGTLITLTLGTS